MKTSSFTTLLAACGITLAGPLAAQDGTPKPLPPLDNAPPSAEQPTPGPEKPRPSRPDGDQDRPRHPESGRNRGDRDGQDRRGPQPEMKPTAYIGVFTRPLSDEVRAQTGLPDGFGLLVEEVMPDSPAQTAGLKQHDVLVLLGDQRLVNQDQLASLVRAEKKDTAIVFTLRRAGAEQKVTVTVGEKLMPVAALDRDGVFEPFRGFFKSREGERLGQDMREQADRFNQGIKEFGDRVQDWARGPKDRPGPQSQRRDSDREPGSGPSHRRPQGRPPGDNQAPRSDASSSSSSSKDKSFQRNVVRRDDSGVYSLSEDNGARILTVKPTTGEEQTFIVNTEEQRKAVPEAYQAKLKELENVDGKVKEGAPATPPAAEAKPGI